VLVSLLGLCACAAPPRWKLGAVSYARDSAIAGALDDFDHGVHKGGPEEVPDLPPPLHLRPCCAFGDDLKVEVGVVPVPGFSVDNLRGLTDIGPHVYDAGLVSLNAADDRGMIDNENNGLVYTCRGGFIDLAHVRDNADLTLFLEFAIARRLETGGSIALVDEGGTRRVVLHPFEPQRIQRLGRRVLAANLAAWAAFQLSVWHEIAQWYGYESLPGWSEGVSAFSLEDLYSNLLGVKIARGIVLDRVGMQDERAYNRTMDAWIPRVLERLDAVSKDSARHALYSVDGVWWDSSKRLPDRALLRRRSFEIGPDLTPWLVTMTYAPIPGPYHDCDGRGDALVLHLPPSFDNLSFAGVISVEIGVGDTLLAHNFPLPRTDSHTITQADFPGIIDHIRRENADAFGPDADHP